MTNLMEFLACTIIKYNLLEETRQVFIIIFFKVVKRQKNERNIILSVLGINQIHCSFIDSFSLSLSYR